MNLFNSHNTDNIEIRPRFRLISTKRQDDIVSRINVALPKQKEVVGLYKGDHFFLSIPEQDQHYWSPVMEVVVRPYYEDKSKTLVRCLLGPKQSIWVMLMFFYVAAGLLALFGGMYGLAKWNLGKESIFIWAIPCALLLAALIYFTAKYGQRKGRDQMLYLVSFLYHAINDDQIERL